MTEGDSRQKATEGKRRKEEKATVGTRRSNRTRPLNRKEQKERSGHQKGKRREEKVGCDCGDASAFGFAAFRGGVNVAIVAANGARVVVICQLQVVSWWYPVSLCFVIEPILYR